MPARRRGGADGPPRGDAAASSPSLPLDGVRVLDFTQVMMGIVLMKTAMG